MVLFARLQFFLGYLHVVLDVSQEEVLVQRMDITNMALSGAKTLRCELSSRWSKTLHQRSLRTVASVQPDSGVQLTHRILLQHNVFLIERLLVGSNLLEDLLVLGLDSAILVQHLLFLNIQTLGFTL